MSGSTDQTVLVSVVIPARNAASTLRRQLDALDRQTFGGKFLVVVVDNDSSDGTTEVATSYHPEHYRLEVVREPRVGINIARNTGVASTPDGSVFLCDADDEVADDWLLTMATALGPGTWVAGALDYTRLNSPRTRRVWNAPVRSVHRPTDPFVDDTRGCNCGFARVMWAELGGFDERLSGTGGDENEMFMRAYDAGYHPSHAATAIVSYRLRPGLGSMVRQRYRQGRNQVVMSRLPGGLLLPGRHTVRSCLAALLRVFAVGPRDLILPDRRFLWIASVSRHAGRLVALSRPAMNIHRP